MDSVDLFRRACASYGEVVHAVGADQWELPTPCSEWDVRDLVGHLVSECCWVPDMLEGRTIEEVGDRYEGDLLGDDPVAAWDAAADRAVTAVAQPDVTARTVHLSFGDHPGELYLMQLFADLLVHRWDLARAVGADERGDPELVAACLGWFRDQEDGYRRAGVVGPRVEVGGDADDESRLLALFGRDAAHPPTLTVVERFNRAFATRDLDAVMATMTGDCVFESTAPPDGHRCEGQAEVRRAWELFFAGALSPRFDVEERIVAGDRATVRWRYSWREPSGVEGHVRGVDVFRVVDGRVAEKLSYVKG